MPCTGYLCTCCVRRRRCGAVQWRGGVRAQGGAGAAGGAGQGQQEGLQQGQVRGHYYNDDNDDDDDRGTSRIFVALFDYDPPTMSPNPEACDEELPFREGQLIKVSIQTRDTWHVTSRWHVPGVADNRREGRWRVLLGRVRGQVGLESCSYSWISTYLLTQVRLRPLQHGERGPGGWREGRQGAAQGRPADAGRAGVARRRPVCRYHYLLYLYLNYTNTQVGRHLRRGRHQEDDRAVRLRPHGAVSQCGHGGGSRYLQLYLQSHYLHYPGQVELNFQTGDIITVFGEMDDDGFYMAELRGQRGLVPR